MLYGNLRQFLTTVDELRDVGLQKYVNLPRIVVIGTQSAGKSSVLESIIGLNVLPRHSGVCTRRPLELRLVHMDEREHTVKDAWAQFADNPKKFTNLEEVTAEILRLTDQVAGRNKGIVDDPITMTLHATVCPDLTVIDLPGITRVPLKDSEQGDDIEQVTKAMTMRYIQDPRTICLAVMAANQDLSTSDALQLARQVDPKGIRTIGVLTKIDIMDRGTDAMKALRGDEIPLRLGYVGVKNRSQADIDAGMQVQQALDAEDKWFAEHARYSKLPPGHTGTRSLVDKLTVVMYHHIKSFLPQICREIQDKKTTVAMRLSELGDGVPVDDFDRVQLMWTMVTDYCEMFRNTIRGKFDRRLQMYTGTEDVVHGGSQIRNIFSDLMWELDQNDCLSGMSDDEMNAAIRLHEGDSLPGFPSMDTFEFLMLPHLRKIEVPCMQCLDHVASTVEQLTQRIAHAVFRRFPKMAQQVIALSKVILDREAEATRSIVQHLVEAETGYLFTNDEDFLVHHGGMESIFKEGNKSVAKAKAKAPGGKAPPPAAEGDGLFEQDDAKPDKGYLQSAQEGISSAYTSVSTKLVGAPPPPSKKKPVYAAQFVNEIRNRLNSYFKVVVRNVRDGVPKAIGWFLVRSMMSKIQFELYTALNKPDGMADLLGEPAHIVEERKQLAGQRDTLGKAYDVLQRDPVMVNQLSFALENIDLDDEALAAPAPQPKAARGSTSFKMTPQAPTTQAAPKVASRPAAPVTAPATVGKAAAKTRSLFEDEGPVGGPL